jgi:predicted metallopeptidase
VTKTVIIAIDIFTNPTVGTWAAVAFVNIFTLLPFDFVAQIALTFVISDGVHTRAYRLVARIWGDRTF